MAAFVGHVELDVQSPQHVAMGWVELDVTAQAFRVEIGWVELDVQAIN